MARSPPRASTSARSCSTALQPRRAATGLAPPTDGCTSCYASTQPDAQHHCWLLQLHGLLVAQNSLNTFLMEDLPEPLQAEIVKRVTRTTDLNSLSLVSKRLYNVDAEERGTICVGCGLHPAMESFSKLCSRFPNLWKVVIDYSGWTSVESQGKQLGNQGLSVLSSHCSSLTDLSLSFCKDINDYGLGFLALCMKLKALRLSSTPAITSIGLFTVAVGCKSLSTFHLIDCIKVDKVEWLEYLGRAGSAVELVKECKGISQFDLLKFGPGWMKLEKFEFENYNNYWSSGLPPDSAFDPDYPYKFDICCENLKDLRLAHITTMRIHRDSGLPAPTGNEIGLRFLLRKCKALEKLCLDYVVGLDEDEMIPLFQNCTNLKSLSLRLMPRHQLDWAFRTTLTDESLKALGLCCPMLEVVELTFTFCSSDYPTEIGFAQKGIVALIQTCPIRAFMLNGANMFYHSGLEDISSAPFLERLELLDCERISDAGMSYIARAPRLTSLNLCNCINVTDDGIAELAHSAKLESLTVVGCKKVSREGVQGAARLVRYSADHEGHDTLKGMKYRSKPTGPPVLETFAA